MLKVGQGRIVKRELHENVGRPQFWSDHDEAIPIRLLLPFPNLGICAVEGLGAVESYYHRPGSTVLRTAIVVILREILPVTRTSDRFDMPADDAVARPLRHGTPALNCQKNR